MILTETLFRKMSSLALLKETQSHSEIMTRASAVLKLAHKRGVELEYILEVRIFVTFLYFHCGQSPGYSIMLISCAWTELMSISPFLHTHKAVIDYMQSFLFNCCDP